MTTRRASFPLFIYYLCVALNGVIVIGIPLTLLIKFGITILPQNQIIFGKFIAYYTQPIETTYTINFHLTVIIVVHNVFPFKLK